jgi:glycosyltransferase involved in cell wall biosynthesis
MGLLERFFQSLHDFVDSCADLSFEVIVVDNASTDGSAKLIKRRFTSAHLIENEKMSGLEELITKP